jgi:ribosomal-protein-alanine N-acetyltransferase
MQAAEERLLRAGCQSVFLEVAVNNLPALAFYKKHGYSVIKSLRRYYPGGLDGLLMRKQLAG